MKERKRQNENEDQDITKWVKVWLKVRRNLRETEIRAKKTKSLKQVHEHQCSISSHTAEDGMMNPMNLCLIDTNDAEADELLLFTICRLKSKFGYCNFLGTPFDWIFQFHKTTSLQENVIKLCMHRNWICILKSFHISSPGLIFTIKNSAISLNRKSVCNNETMFPGWWFILIFKQEH